MKKYIIYCELSTGGVGYNYSTLIHMCNTCNLCTPVLTLKKIIFKIEFTLFEYTYKCDIQKVYLF